jgi:hypothetical protein
VSEAPTCKNHLQVADPWPAQASRVLAVLARGQVVEDTTPGWVRIEARDVTLHIRRDRLEAIQASRGGSAGRK